ncbi:hypothetical protein [Chryseosolibacter indicus]|uniref:DUF3592 domain-containing protein n=1 Tax=Chryseosolibacter indicus TaxID=2782351 RepID=A0ABS5VPL4_9BACT|nr:hypothetical protein [Chryseosolibacter indicus]MBT1703382.1 hypothetical protein [Chryseosolibacter indicus]
MNTRRIVWLALLILDLFVFFFLIPIDVYDSADILLSFIGAIGFGICLFMFLGNFGSLYEIFGDTSQDEQESIWKKMAALSLIPSLVLVIVLVMYRSDEKSDELSTYGKLTKGQVVNGKSTTSRRRFQSNTSYSINVSYVDSLQKIHTFEASVSGSDFNNLYQGAIVDVIYSKRYPSLAEVVFDLEQLSKYIKINNEPVNITHLLTMLEGKVRRDSIVDYLNSINYEWYQDEEREYYRNDRRNLAINLEHDILTFVKPSNLLVSNNERNSFENTILDKGFEKKASEINGETQVMYYNNAYIIYHQRKSSNHETSMAVSFYDIYQIMKVSGK